MASRALPPHLLRTLVSGLLLAALGGVQALGLDPRVQDLVRVLDQQAKEPFEQDQRERAIRKLGAIGGPDAAAALVPLLEDPFLHIRDRALGAWIAMLSGPGAAGTRGFLARHGLTDARPNVRRASAAALGICAREVSPALGAAITREREPAVLAALADAAAGLREEPEVGRAIVERLLGTRDGRAVLHLAAAAGAVAGAEAVPALERLLEHREPLARAGAVSALQALDALPERAIERIVGDPQPPAPMALAESLARRTRVLPWPGRGREVLVRLLRHPSWRVRAAAVQGALRIWEPGIVEPLIAHLADGTARIRDDASRALETFTGQSDLGVDAELWTAWWRARGPDFAPPPRPEPDEAGNVRFRDVVHEPVRRGTTTVAFYDMPLRSQRLAFVFDLSGSMRSPARKGAKDGPTKLDVLRREMRKTLETLPPETAFDLFVYRYDSSYPPRTELTRALGRFRPCSSQTIRRALEWLDKQEAKGWGAFYEPLEALLEEDVDSAILLSDGSPSRGRYDQAVRILTEYPLANRFHRLAVHTVLVGTRGADRKFMEALAAATGGRFRAAAGE